VNPHGGEVSECKFEYGTTTSYGQTALCSPSPGKGESPVAVSAAISGLSPNTTYHFRISATNWGGTSQGSDSAFEAKPPTVKTEAASKIRPTSATLNATVNPNGGVVSDCKFEYGTTTAYGSTVQCASLPGSGYGAVAVSASVTLAVNTAYHFRVVATNPTGTSQGNDEMFMTPLAPHYYKEGSLVTSTPVPVTSWGTLTLKTVLGGSMEITCRGAAAGTIDNPAGGGSGVGSTEMYTTYNCANTSCPFLNNVWAESLPWPSELEEVSGGIRVERTQIKLSVLCWASKAAREKALRGEEELPQSRKTFVGEDKPKFETGTSAGHPGFLFFETASGQLEQEGSNKSILAESAGKLKVLGYKEAELITVRTP
jgi:hypothetical protein